MAQSSPDLNPMEPMGTLCHRVYADNKQFSSTNEQKVIIVSDLHNIPETDFINLASLIKNVSF